MTSTVIALYTIIILGIALGEINNHQDEIARYLAKRGRKRTKSASKTFYSSKAWRDLRYEVLKFYEATCMCCGASKETGGQIHVDHILPRSLYPDLRLEFSNMQVLCGDCNMAKSNTDYTDWRD